LSFFLTLLVSGFAAGFDDDGGAAGPELDADPDAEVDPDPDAAGVAAGADVSDDGADAASFFFVSAARESVR
jgi:hypothetical protein